MRARRYIVVASCALVGCNSNAPVESSLPRLSELPGVYEIEQRPVLARSALNRVILESETITLRTDGRYGAVTRVRTETSRDTTIETATTTGSYRLSADSVELSSAAGARATLFVDARSGSLLGQSSMGVVLRYRRVPAAPVVE